MSEEINLKRTCWAMLIPSGVKVRLAESTPVLITHRLGGNFTVKGPFGVARIEGIDADALGEPVPENPDKPKTQPVESEHKFALPEKDELWSLAKTVYDPEIPVNIVDLGLVYRIDAYTDVEGKNNVEVDMTLTAPGCSLGPVIADDLKMRLEAMPGVDKAEVNIVWDPPWNKDMISEEGKMILGLV